ncbi:MAG: hypothetical protein ACI8RD_004351, partial [Bacillariaceae sp.]|jgi:hypothetical protein
VRDFDVYDKLPRFDLLGVRVKADGIINRKIKYNKK